MQRRILTAGVAAITILGLAACAPASETGGGGGTAEPAEAGLEYTTTQELLDAYPVSEVCGTESLQLAFPAGIVNAWMKQTYQMIVDAAAQCDNITDVLLVDAQLDQQKAVSDVNSLVAQGVQGIVTLPVFGAAQVPSFRSAQNAGVPVVTIVADSDGAVPADVSRAVLPDTLQNGRLWAGWLGKNLQSGTVIFLGNSPGQPSSQASFDAFKAAVAEYPDLELLEPDGFVPTNNSAVDKKRVMTAMLAKHGRIDAVVTDNGAIDSSVIEAYQQAGEELPYIANTNTTNGLGCQWAKSEFPLFAVDGANAQGAVGVYFLLAAINGIETDLPTTVKSYTAVDSLDGLPPQCDPDVSPDADWSTGFSAAQFREILG